MKEIEVTVVEQGEEKRPNVPPARRPYARRDGGSLFKGRCAEKMFIQSIKEELIDLREW